MLFTTLALLPGATVAQPQEQDAPLRVLLLHSFQRELPFSANFENGFEEALKEEGRPYTLYVEALDAARFGGPAHMEATVAYLSEKYAATPVDVVIANSRPAGDLLASAPGLLPEARRVFANGPRADAEVQAPDEGLLIHATFAYGESLLEVMRLAAPDTLYVVGDTSDASGRARVGRFQEAVEEMELEIPVEYLLDQPLPALLERVSGLPPGAAVYELGVFKDGGDRVLRPIQVTRRLADAASVPVFSYWKAAGTGAVGGLVLSAGELGRLTGQTVLDGPSTGAVETAGLSYIYDWQALERWGLTDAGFPPEATFLNRMPGLWEAYPRQVIAALVVGALLLGLSIMLFAAIVARRQRERELEDSEMRFRGMADNLPQLAWMARPDGWIFWFNERWHAFTGATLEQMQGWGWKSVHHPDHVDRVVTNIQHSWDTGEPWEDTFPLRGADGSYRWFLSRARPVRDAAGGVKLWFGTNTDITEQMQAEEALRESEERLVAIVEQLSEGLVIFDSEGQAVHWNPAALEMHGFSRTDERLRTVPDLAEVFEFRALEDGEVVSPADWIVPRVLRGETIRNFEARLIRPDTGWERIFSYSGSLVHNGKGEMLVVLVIADVTERRQTEERQRLLMREVDHRAKNALAVVLSVVKLTKADTIEAFKSAIEGRVSALARTHNLLAQSRWDEVELDVVIREELRPYTEGEMSGRVTLSGPPILVRPGGVQPLTMVIHELTTNAAKYGALSVDAGRLDIHWNLDGDGNLSLTWNEIGAPSVKVPERIGFGSTLIQSTVTSQLGGTIEQQWRPDGLHCAMRLSEGTARRASPETAEMPRRNGTPHLPSSGTTKAARVLVVEDEPLIAARIVDDLRQAGYQPVGPAASLKAALAKARSEQDLHAALVDINLNGEESWPVIDVLRERGVPFSFATGYTGVSEQVPTGPVLEKPFSTDQLMEMLKRLLVGPRSPGGGAPAA
ncbi:PAS domain S-box protein [Tranquillimonas alkanivorans]|uniref:PAS domain S-box protein n=1 Tax=Tranquillimonas alkanivorans TaxID=441119 RepID=UPI0015A6CABE|nr:PAS domain S-box protein [Tranquillimonas alkanivorans]